MAIDGKRLMDPCLVIIIHMYVYDDDDTLSCIIIIDSINMIIYIH